MRATITRREVNAALLGLARALATRPCAMAVPSVPLRVFDFAIAGGWHHALGRLPDGLPIGVRLALRAEPDNPHDPHAVAVVTGDGVRLGYIPRLANAPVAALLAEGRSLMAEVIGRLRASPEAEIPTELVFTSFTDGDPLLRLVLLPPSADAPAA